MINTEPIYPMGGNQLTRHLISRKESFSLCVATASFSTMYYKLVYNNTNLD